MDIVIDNVRCFCGSNIIPIAPLSILTGENSSGKTTFLSAFSLISNRKFPFAPSFNDSPYELGSYDTIATYKGGREGRAKNFSLGCKIKIGKKDVEIIARYINDKGQARVDYVYIRYDDITINIDVIDIDRKFVLVYSLYKDAACLIEKERLLFPLVTGTAEILLIMIANDIQNKLKDSNALTDNELIFNLSVLAAARETVSIAPIRTKPLRTYDHVDSDYYPEGMHVPIFLAKYFFDKKKQDRKDIAEALEKFGIESGMFNSISVRRLGRNISDPFQLLVKIAKQKVNLIDVGYGVSQALPVLVESARLDNGKVLLLQQPEVHLHPRAQAALGTFFSTLAGKEHKKFIIETHSDYIIDRVRQEISRGTIKPNEVGLYFFEKKDYCTKIHIVKFDNNGNLVSAPDSYRDFFLQEELNLLRR